LFAILKEVDTFQTIQDVVEQTENVMQMERAKLNNVVGKAKHVALLEFLATVVSLARIMFAKLTVRLDTTHPVIVIANVHLDSNAVHLYYIQDAIRVSVQLLLPLQLVLVETENVILEKLVILVLKIAAFVQALATKHVKPKDIQVEVVTYSAWVLQK